MAKPIEPLAIFKVNFSLLNAGDLIEIYLDDKTKLYAWSCAGDLLLDPDLVDEKLLKIAEACAADHDTTLFRYSRNVTGTNGRLRICVGPIPFVKREPLLRISFLIGNTLCGTKKSSEPVFTVQQTTREKVEKQSRPRTRV